MCTRAARYYDYEMILNVCYINLRRRRRLLLRLLLRLLVYWYYMVLHGTTTSTSGWSSQSLCVAESQSGYSLLAPVAECMASRMAKREPRVTLPVFGDRSTDEATLPEWLSGCIDFTYCPFKFSIAKC